MTGRGREQAAAGQEGLEAAAVPVVPDGVPGEGRVGGGASDCLSPATGSLARRGGCLEEIGVAWPRQSTEGRVSQFSCAHNRVRTF